MLDSPRVPLPLRRRRAVHHLLLVLRLLEQRLADLLEDDVAFVRVEQLHRLRGELPGTLHMIHHGDGRLVVAELDAVELFFERGWTDGLAIVPPTQDLVEAMIRASGREPQEEIGEIPPVQGIATIEKLAINSVMAGCRSEYFPIVIAAVEAMLVPEHNLNGVQTTTHCCVPLVIVNGPIATQLKFNASDGVFGNGFRANGTVGRAIRLILWNLGGNVPGEVDKSTQAHPGKWSFCIAEKEDASPWSPFHVERGIETGKNAVTVFSDTAADLDFQRFETTSRYWTG